MIYILHSSVEPPSDPGRFTAGTIKLEVNLPTDHPILSVSTTPIPGWTAATTKVALNPPVTTDDGIVSETVSPSPGPPTRACGSNPASTWTSRSPSARCPPTPTGS